VELPRSFQGASCLPIDAIPTAVREAALAGNAIGGYLYDLQLARDRAARLIAALPPAGRVLYAVKANSFPPLLNALADVVHGFEVASVAEARLAAKAGAERLVVSGPAKNPRLLAGLLAPELPPLTVNVESLLELHRLSQAAVDARCEVAVALRVNPATSPVRVERAEGLTMGGLASPFGLPETDVPAAVEALKTLPGVKFVGFHFHAVSGNMDAVLHAEYVRWALEWSLRTGAEHRLQIRTIDVGGGLGIPFEPGPEFDLAAFSAALPELPSDVELILEPGRWLAGPTGWYVTEVVDVKHSYGETFVVIRGGINHFQLPTSWEIRHNFAVLPVRDWSLKAPRPTAITTNVTVAGELCTPEDMLARGVNVAAVSAGDLLIFPNAGAYGYEFAMPEFLGQPSATRAALPEPARRGGLTT
jgi:diaminopimelate decarboxylase